MEGELDITLVEEDISKKKELDGEQQKEVDGDKGPSLEKDKEVEEEAEEGQVEQEVDDKKPSRSQRLKRQRDEWRTKYEELQGRVSERDIEDRKNTFTKVAQEATQIEILEKTVKEKLELAEKQQADAFDSNNKDEFMKAQRAVFTATNELSKLNEAKGWSQRRVKQLEEESKKPPPQKANPAAQEFVKENSWIFKDPKLKGYALGLDKELEEEGYDPFSDEHYVELKKRLTETFPTKFTNKGAPPVGGGGRGSNKPSTFSDLEKSLMNKWNISSKDWLKQRERIDNPNSQGYTTILTE